MITSEEIKQFISSIGGDKCGIAAFDRFNDAPAGFHPAVRQRHWTGLPLIRNCAGNYHSIKMKEGLTYATAKPAGHLAYI